MDCVCTQERYKHHLNFSHEAVAQLHLVPDTCALAPGVMVIKLSLTRLGLARAKLWGWMHLSDKSVRVSVFLGGAGRTQ